MYKTKYINTYPLYILFCTKKPAMSALAAAISTPQGGVKLL